MDSLKIPSKTFLLGEYSVLETGQAVLLGHSPFFHFHFSPGNLYPFALESPAGKWLQKHPSKHSITYRDPHRGKGGFGGSGAELLAAMVASEVAPFPLDPWWVLDQTKDLGGSGADLLVQSFSRKKDPSFLWLDKDKKELIEIFPELEAKLSIFHTGKKVPTHSHLKESFRVPKALKDLTLEGKEAFCKNEVKTVGEIFSSIHQELRRANLQASHTCRALDQLSASVPSQNLYGAKGCGAMGSDVIVVLHNQAPLEDWAKENSLALIAEFSV